LGFVRVCAIADVPPGTIKVYEIGDRQIAVCNANGDLYAVENVCTHDGGALDQGELIGFDAECPRHGARFDVRSGEVTQGPAFLPVDTFAVRVDGDEIQLDV